MQFCWKEFGYDIKNFRENNCYGLRELAKEIKVHYSTLSRAENGKPTSVVHFLRLCKKIGADPFYYLP